MKVSSFSDLPSLRAALIGLFLLCVLFITAPAQTQFMGWGATFLNYKTDGKSGLYFDGQIRSTDQLQQTNSLLLRPGINFYFTPSLTGTIGYAYVQQQRTSAGVVGYLPGKCLRRKR